MPLSILGISWSFISSIYSMCVVCVCVCVCIYIYIYIKQVSVQAPFRHRHRFKSIDLAPVSKKTQTIPNPIGDTVESFAQQFSAAQKQTEAIKHIMRRRKPAASTPAAAPQPARRRGRPSAAAPTPAQPQQPSARQRRGAGRRQDAQPSRPPPNLAVSAGARGPETGDPEMEETAHREMVTAPLPPPEEGRVENLLFRFVSVPKTSIKEQFPQSLGLKRRRVVNRASRDHFPLPLSPGGRWLPKSTPPAHSWN